jgi:hypothetical protein
MLFDGAIAQALINNAPTPATARNAAETLLDAHGVTGDGLPANNRQPHGAGTRLARNTSRKATAPKQV